jgi:hypothetical protein
MAESLGRLDRPWRRAPPLITPAKRSLRECSRRIGVLMSLAADDKEAQARHAAIDLLGLKRFVGRMKAGESAEDASTRAPSVVGASIYLFTDRGSRLAGIAILAGRLDNLRSAGVTATGLGSGIGTSTTASGPRTSHWHIL